MITDIKHVVIPVEDQNRALKFYSEKLGFKVVTDTPFEGSAQRWIELKIPKSDTRVVLYTTEEHKVMLGNFSNIVFSCKDVVKTTKQLIKKGVEIVEGPVERPWGIFSIFVDSEGNGFCLSSCA